MFPFLSELELNNNREWFEIHKKRYEVEVKKPFLDLITRVISLLQMEEPEITMTAKDALFRIHRDVRFSKDKSPYKTHVSAHISRGGRKDMAEPGLYIEIGADKGGIAGGIYMPDKQQLTAIRSWIAEHPQEFRAAITSKSFVSEFGEIRGERNKIVPNEFRDVVQEEPLISLKQFYYWKDLSPSFLASKDLASEIVRLHNAAKPVRDVLRAALHAS